MKPPRLSLRGNEAASIIEGEGRMDWVNIVAGGFAIAMLGAAFTMMFTGLWTQRNR